MLNLKYINFSAACIILWQIYWEYKSASALIGRISKTFYLLSVCVASYLYDMEWTAWRHVAVIH